MHLIRANCELLQQGIDLLERHDDQSFVAADPSSYGSGIGSHFRHVLDHYRSFLAGLEGGLIDYDNRKRDTLMERDLETAQGALRETLEAFRAAEVDPEGSVRVAVSASTDSEGQPSRSSFGRELQFLVSHTVHHYALIAIASRLQGIYPDDSFGVAPSTLKYLRTARG